MPQISEINMDLKVLKTLRDSLKLTNKVAVDLSATKVSSKLLAITKESKFNLKVV